MATRVLAAPAASQPNGSCCIACGLQPPSVVSNECFASCPGHLTPPCSEGLKAKCLASSTGVGPSPSPSVPLPSPLPSPATSLPSLSPSLPVASPSALPPLPSAPNSPWANYTREVGKVTAGRCNASRHATQLQHAATAGRPAFIAVVPTPHTAADPDAIRCHKNAQQHNHRQVACSACRLVHGSFQFGPALGLERRQGDLKPLRAAGLRLASPKGPPPFAALPHAASDEECATLCNEDLKCEYWTWCPTNVTSG